MNSLTISLSLKMLTMLTLTGNKRGDHSAKRQSTPPVTADIHLQLRELVQLSKKNKRNFGNHLEDGLPVDGSVVNNSGDRFRPITGVCGSPSKWPFYGL